MAANKDFETRLFINGEFVDAKSSERLTCHNPIDGSVVSSDIHVAGKEDVDAAVAAASKAFPEWSSTQPQERAKILNKLADLMDEHADELIRLETLCSGKPVGLTKMLELPLASKTFRYYAGWCDKVGGESLPAHDGFMKIVNRVPIGVCAAILPFNGPFLFTAFKVAPCLAAGNAMVVKASEKTPITALFIGTLCNMAGVPPGVINFISGGPSTGALLASDMVIRKISFTGSVDTGRKVAEAAAKSNLKNVSLELGGKNPSIVFPDANLDVAVNWCVQGITLNSGQACFASSRIYVHKDIREKFVGAMKAAFESLDAAFGDPYAPTTTIASLVDKLQLARVSEFVESGKKEATLVAGGSAFEDKVCTMRPTIFIDPKPDARVYKEEIFGPVVVINEFEDEADVIARANDTEFGLSGAVFSQDVNRALRISSKINAGTVGINCCAMLDVTVPFGGQKQSGWGREMGKDGLDSWMETQTIFINMTY